MRSIIAVLSAALIAIAGPGSAAEQQFRELGSLKVAAGEIHSCRIGYRTFGEIAPDRSNVVVFPTWFTGRSADLEGLFGPGKLIDTSRWYVIAVDSIGDGVSCSPSNSEAQPRSKFPRFSVEDMVESQRILLGQLGIAHIHAVVGISMGGMQALAWARLHPGIIDKAVSIVGTPQPTAYDLLIWNAEKSAIDESAVWKGGEYVGRPELRSLAGIQAMALATPLRRAQETSHSAFNSFWASTAAGNLGNFELIDWYWQLDALIAFDLVKDGGGSLEALGASIKTPLLIVTSRQDHMINAGPGELLARSAGARLVSLTNDCGHLAPICELPKVAQVIEEFLR